MLIGYARVSKADGSQTLDLQRDALIAASVEEEQIYSDLASGKKDDRSGLEACLKGIVTLTRVRWQRWIFFVVATHEYDCQLQAPPFSARDHHARGLALCAFQPLPTRGRGNAPEPWRRRFL